MTALQETLARLALPLGALGVCAVTDPQHPGAFIACPFRVITGLPCPLCGMTRGVAALLRGRWQEALGFHLFSPLVLAAMAAWILIETGHALRLWNARGIGKWALRPAPWIGALAVCTAYGALRWWGIIERPPA